MTKESISDTARDAAAEFLDPMDEPFRDLPAETHGVYIRTRLRQRKQLGEIIQRAIDAEIQEYLRMRDLWVRRYSELDEKLKRKTGHTSLEWTALESAVAIAEHDLAEARKALKYYSDRSNWENNEIAADHSHIYAAVQEDKGEVARKALAKINAGPAEETDRG